MADDDHEFVAEQDSLHIMPLRILPLETAGLKRARLVKNTRLEGMVELFKSSGGGSGQIRPQDLYGVFDFENSHHDDVEMIKALAALPSFDIYSLRIELRKLGIAIDEHESLSLSDGKKQELASYMADFTRPLVASVFGADHDAGGDYCDVPKLLMNPDVAVARDNLGKLADTLGIEIPEIPKFLEDYGDVYLSLAYYSYCLDENLPHIEDFLATCAEVKQDPLFKSDKKLVAACSLLERKLQSAQLTISNTLEIFRLRTEGMWRNISRDSFRKMERLVNGYQSKIGGSLCAISVKMRGWTEIGEHMAGRNRAAFILNEMKPGIEMIEEITFSND